MSKRPKFTIAHITEQFDVSRSTVRRGINTGRFPNAEKDHHGRWLIPIDDVLQAGVTPRKTWLNEGGHDPGHEPGSQGGHEPGQLAQNSMEANEQAGVMNQVHLENELAHERAQVDKLKALLDAERNHVESLRMALRMIEPGISTPSPAETIHGTKPANTTDFLPEHSSPEPRHAVRKPRLLQRLFKPRGNHTY